MRAQEILSHGIELRKNADKSYSHTGKQDFTPEEPEIKTLGPRAPYSRPRTRASQNNSYT